MCATNKIHEEDCDELDEMFKNIALKEDSTDRVPLDWLDNNIHPLPNTTEGLSTVYEGGESKYRSSKSAASSLLSKDSGHLDISQDSLINLVKRGEASKDSLDQSFVTGKTDVLSTEMNDTLEDVEYVCDEKNRYHLKPVSKSPKISISISSSMDQSNDADSSVIVIDSSPDVSFATAQMDVKEANMKLKSIKTEPLSDRSLSVDASISLASTISSTNMSFTTAKNELKLTDTDEDINSEMSCDKTSTMSEGKSWSTLDSNGNTSTADQRNEIMREETNKSSELGDGKADASDEGQMMTCISYPKTSSFFEDDEDKTIDSDAGKSSEYFTAAATVHDSTSSSSLVSATRLVCLSFFRFQIDTRRPFNFRYNTLDEIPSISTDSTLSSVSHSICPQTSSNGSPKYFDDSLERIEYMMRKGRELQQKSNSKAATEKSSASATNSPASQYKMPTPKTLGSSSQKRPITATASKTSAVKAKLFTNSAKKPPPQAITPASRILQPFNRVVQSKAPMERKFVSPRASPIVSPAFKKPNQTSNQKKEPPASRIPTSKHKHFEHIVSPIGAYIKNIAAPPLLANVKPTTDFFDSSYCNKMSKNLDYSVMSDASMSQPVTSSLPVKFFTSSEQQRVIDEKFQKIPGGEKLNRIIGQMPSVISHQGRIHSGSPMKRSVPIDDSFANVSVMSGDISVQVVRDVKRH